MEGEDARVVEEEDVEEEEDAVDVEEEEEEVVDVVRLVVDAVGSRGPARVAI